MSGPTFQRFKATIEGRQRGGIVFGIPFDPASVWGELDAYYVRGTAGGQPWRGRLSGQNGHWSMVLGPTWCRAPGFGPGDVVEILIETEGPRTTDAGADIATAFADDPAAARFFDSLPTFDRKNLIRWIDEAKQVATRDRRIAETVELARQRRSRR